MFSNGIISFVDPAQSGLNGSNLSVQPMSQNMGSTFDYSIFPLWTDLINLSGTFKTEGTSTYQKYYWIGISPFYDPNRINTFNVEIRPDGKIIANYSLVDVNYGQVGLTGYTKNNEYETILSSNGPLSSVNNWERVTGVANPCDTNPLYSASCPGFADAMAKLTPPTPIQETAITTTNATSTASVTEPVQSSPTAPTTNTSVAASATLSSPNATNSQPKVGEVTVSSSQTKNTMSTSQVLAMVRSEQTRIGNLETSTAQQAVEQSQASSDQAQQESLSVSASNVNQSQSLGGIGFQSPIAKIQNIYSSTSTQTQTGLIASTNSPQVSYSIIRNEPSRSQNEEPVKSEGMKFNSTNPIFNIINSPPQTQSSTQETQTTSSVNTKVKDNDAAGSVSLDMIAKQPKGFESYMNVVPDVAFYAPKDIYKNQVTVDNVRALRQLSSDRLHQEMVEQQYRK